MTDPIVADVSPEGRDLRELTDELRQQHSIIKNTANEWVLLKHADVLAAALDDKTFSSAVSRYRQIPNGLDGEEHTRFRRVIDHYLSGGALQPFVAVFQQTARELIAELPRGQVLDAVNDVGARFAVRAQCAWLGWPRNYEARLLQWMQDNHAATRSKDTHQTAAVAQQFDDIIREIIQLIRQQSEPASPNLTRELCADTRLGRPLSEEELVSVLRNWTGGDLGSIALCVGVILCQVATDPALAAQLKTATDTDTEAIIDELLRQDNPFVANRRITTCPVALAGQHIPAGAVVKLNWTSANRDETVFADNAFNPQANRPHNLVYGAGRHSCPGRGLATLELRIMLQTLLASTERISLAPGQPPVREIAPLGGYQRVPVIFD